MKAEIIKAIERELMPKREFPVFKAGDTITVHYKIIQGTKERVQQYQGVVIQRSGDGSTKLLLLEKYQEILVLKEFSLSVLLSLKRLNSIKKRCCSQGKDILYPRVKR